MYRFVFLDLDDTILDFHAQERFAYAKALGEYGVPATESLLARYHAANLVWWERHERGEVDRETLLVERHRAIFETLGVSVDPSAFEDRYRHWLGVGHTFVPGAPELLDYLKGKGYRLYLASNGVAETQYTRLASAGIGSCFDRIFISEDLGSHKPERAFFDACFSAIPDFDPTAAVLVGDSLTSDVCGAKNAGIASIWFNRNGRIAPPELRPDAEITTLEELRRLL